MSTIEDSTAERPAPGWSPLVRAPHPHDLMTVVPAQASALRGVRALLREWLAEQVWPAAAVDDIELAVNEAVANVIDHAYPPGHPGTAILHAWVSVDPARSRRVVATVLDRGRWATHHPDTYLAAARGHGLVVMGGAMAELHIQRGTGGTTVIMVSAAVPASPVPDGAVVEGG